MIDENKRRKMPEPKPKVKYFCFVFAAIALAALLLNKFAAYPLLEEKCKGLREGPSFLQMLAVGSWVLTPILAVVVVFFGILSQFIDGNLGLRLSLLAMAIAFLISFQDFIDTFKFLASLLS